MTNISVDSKKFIRAIGQTKRLVGDIAYMKVLKAAHLVARSAKHNAPKASSQLTNSIQVKRAGALKAEVFAGSEYGAEVELGRKPNSPMPSIQSIKDWIKTKSIETNNINSAAFLIARSIGKKGIKPQPFMEDAARQNKAAVLSLIKSSAGLAIKKAGL